MFSKSKRMVVVGLALGLASIGYLARQNHLNSVAAEKFVQWAQIAENTRDHISSLLVNVTIAEAAARSYVLTGQQDFLETFNSAHDEGNEQLRLLSQDALSFSALQGDIVALEQVVSLRIEHSALVIQLRREVGVVAAQAEVETGKGRVLMLEVKSKMNTTDLHLAKLLRDGRANVVNMETDWRNQATVGCFLILALSIGMVAVLLRESHLGEFELEAKKLSEHRMRLATADAGIGVWDWDVGTGTVIWDARMFQIYGLAATPDMIASYQDWRASILPSDLAETEEALLRTVATNSRSQREFRIVRANDKAIRVIQASEITITNTGGNTSRVVGTNRDVTDERASQDKIRILNLELAQASKHKDEFLTNMSHELRTPLNAILGMSEMLLEQVSGPLNTLQINSITTISKSGDHLLELINDILDLSKIESGKLAFNPEWLIISELCESCMTFVNAQAKHKQIGVDLRIDTGAAEFFADPRLFKQILVNLLINAVKFTQDGGRIGLSVVAPLSGEKVCFMVSDSGIGISPDDQKRLFRPFAQVDSSVTRKQEGSGLGLALVAKLCELHGGSVTIESELGRGSRFIVSLPRGIRPFSGVQPLPPPPEEACRTSFRRALIIEDDAAAGQSLEGLLTNLGLSTVLHASAETAVEVFLGESPDVIFLDILLPNESGWCVLNPLLEKAAALGIPIVLVSIIDNPRRSLAIGAAACITKPVTREALSRFLQREKLSPTKAPQAPVAQAFAVKRSSIILLAEDNPANTEMLGGYLKEKGYDLRYAVNGVEAVQGAKEWNPAVILMDVHMPVMDGLTAIREIRSDPALCSIPIVALTALAMAGDREACLAAGATDYMSKPLKLRVLSELVAKLTRSPVGR